MEEVTAGPRQTLAGLIVATCAALAIGLWLAWFIGGRIARSIIALIGPANALGSGKAVAIPPSYFKEASEVGLALHDAAQALLRAVSLRITHAIRRSDLAARLGGDEFAVALIQCSLESAKAVAGKLIDVISDPYQLGRNLVQVSASIGIAAYPEPGQDCHSLLIRADKATYAAKSLGKRRFSVGAAVLPAAA